jgi:N-hydroxyarylamine O-acetyltransferase
MDLLKYIDRIARHQSNKIDHAYLSKLHEGHIFNIPFENLDVHYKKLFDLDIANIYHKVVDQRRGGFCYELNSLFCDLLTQLGFKSRIIEARIFDDEGNLGPRFDHMSVLVEIDKMYLCDVGYGDLIIQPLEILEGIQSDGRNLFKIEMIEQNEYLLSMSTANQNFTQKYVFYLAPVHKDDFAAICLDKQINPSSYFVKNLVCTKPTKVGRVTIFNDKVIEKSDKGRIEKMIYNETEMKRELLLNFGINLMY